MTIQDRPGSKATGSIDHAERKMLLVRGGMAGALIVALIGALALFEQQQEKPEPAVPESMKSPGASQSLPTPGSQNQAGGAIAPPSDKSAAIKPEPPAEPERTGAPQIAQPATAQRAAVGKPVVETAVPSAPQDTRPRLIVGKGGEPTAAEKPASPPNTSVARPATLEPAIARASAGGGFLLQVGVFSNLGNAEELRKKLADADIPAQIEARVQVGPFATRAETAAAQRKLKSLGMDPGMLVAPRRRP